MNSLFSWSFLTSRKDLPVAVSLNIVKRPGMRLQFLVLEAMEGLSSFGLGASVAAGAPFFFFWFFWAIAGIEVTKASAKIMLNFLFISSSTAMIAMKQQISLYFSVKACFKVVYNLQNTTK